MLYLTIPVIIALTALLIRAQNRLARSERRGVRLERSVLESAREVAEARGQIAALTTALTTITRTDDVVRETSAGITTAILAALDPTAHRAGDQPVDTNQGAPYVGWEDDDLPVDDDGIIIVEGMPPGAPDDWEDWDPVVMNSPFSPPEDTEL